MIAGLPDHLVLCIYQGGVRRYHVLDSSGFHPDQAVFSMPAVIKDPFPAVRQPVGLCLDRCEWGRI